MAVSDKSIRENDQNDNDYMVQNHTQTIAASNVFSGLSSAPNLAFISAKTCGEIVDCDYDSKLLFDSEFSCETCDSEMSSDYESDMY